MCGKKASDFSNQVNALGAVIDLVDAPSGVIRLRNTEKRVRDLDNLMTDIASAGNVGQMEAQLLRGKAFSDHIHAKSYTPEASDRLLSALARLRERLKDGESREIRSVWDRTVYIFSDAFFEPADSDTGLAAGMVQ